MSRYMELFEGTFTGLMLWEQWEALRDTLNVKNDGRWFVYYVGEAVPKSPLLPEEFERFINELDILLRRDHQEDYFGIAYADVPSRPTFIKIYDPNNLGTACGSSGQKVLPGWTVSRVEPVDLKVQLPNPGSRRRWWQSLFA